MQASQPPEAVSTSDETQKDLVRKEDSAFAQPNSLPLVLDQFEFSEFPNLGREAFRQADEAVTLRKPEVGSAYLDYAELERAFLTC